MCEASSLYPYREARRGTIAKVGTVPGYSMRGLFEDGKTIGGHNPAKLVCAQNGAIMFIEKMNLIMRLHNSEFHNEVNLECMFHTEGKELGVGDGFEMKNGVLIPLTDIIDGTRVRHLLAFA